MKIHSTIRNSQFSAKKHQHNRFTHSKTLEKMQDQHKSSVYSGKNYDEFQYEWIFVVFAVILYGTNGQKGK